MAKGQKRGGREPKKPKKDRPKAAAPRSSPFASMQDRQEAAPTPAQDNKK